MTAPRPLLAISFSSLRPSSHTNVVNVLVGQDPATLLFYRKHVGTAKRTGDARASPRPRASGPHQRFKHRDVSGSVERQCGRPARGLGDMRGRRWAGRQPSRSHLVHRFIRSRIGPVVGTGEEQVPIAETEQVVLDPVIEHGRVVEPCSDCSASLGIRPAPRPCCHDL